jgi:hypothetical protein
MVSADGEARYDRTVKKILGNKYILSHILVGTVERLRHMNPKDVYHLIEGEPLIGRVPVNPGMTNQKNGEQITGLNTVDEDIEEGLIIYDVIVYVRLPEGLVQIIVNVEGQKDEPTKYMILNRVIFYACRLISSQKERDFTHQNFDDLKQVYSIWICMDADENCMNHIHLTDDHLLGEHKWKGYLDLLNIFMIGLGENITEAEDEEFALHRLLGTVFSERLTVDEKLTVMENEYGIPMEMDLKEDLEDMCNMSQGIVEKTTRTVTADVTKNVTDKINELNKRLSEDNRVDELFRSFTDKKLQDKLLEEYGLNNVKV